MKKTISLLLSLTLILALSVGCAPQEKEESSPTDVQTPDVPEEPESLGSVRLATLKGPTTMGLVKLLDDASAGSLNYEVESDMYGAPDEIMALLVNEDVDMAAIPCNMASVLYNKTGGKLQIAAINTLGVLYIVELGDSVKTLDDLKGKTVYSTGKGATPEYALNALLTSGGLDPAKDVTVEFKSEATEIAALLSGENAQPGTIAVLPQPYAATVLMANPDARIALSFSDLWEESDLEGKLVTGVLVTRKSFAEENPELVDSFLADYEKSISWVNDNQDEAAQLIVDAGIVPKPVVAKAALPYCSIVFESGELMKTDVSAYLNVLFEQNPTSVGGTLPEDDFFYGAE